MKFSSNIPYLGSAVLAAVLATAPARAAVVATPQNNDIFLGFRASGNLGASTSYLVNLGQYSQFRDLTPGASISLNSLGDIGADLVATFGANWSNRNDLFWGIFGVSNTANPTVYASRESSAPGWSALDQISRGTTSSNIVSVLQGTNGYQGRQATANSAFAVLQPNSDGASSYNKQVSTGGTNDFGSLSTWSSIEGDFGGGTAGTSLDLYRISSTGVTNPGAFSISNSGVVSFTAAIPEPSSALLGVAGSLLIVAGRRRRPTH
ncbi:hypothetical protein JIN84_15765 [Luteolibacter yonseiensis]|uniref:PEP-CTERM protein-sorting domain-containing protein n=1 Tax=Luteolibacter yonseiensis TaxID=1144680 RepID=A0A934R6E0_9BACT|nr:hypothetical protein [Luteolibacter yonseiensis]MBK1817081.1 hypothetical protein [Luteolibacter yonseiensis]